MSWAEAKEAGLTLSIISASSGALFEGGGGCEEASEVESKAEGSSMMWLGLADGEGELI